MRNFKEHSIHTTSTGENSEYLRGYRDGIRDRRVARSGSGDGILGALLAITLIAGIGYFGYNYITTGRLFPSGVDFNPVQIQPDNSQP